AGTWIRGRGYDHSRLAERRHPNRLDWDVVAPDHPVIFTRTCGHIASVNSRALSAAGIDDNTPDPPGGRYDRADGRNLGVAYETAQTPLQAAALPSWQEFRRALLAAARACLAPAARAFTTRAVSWARPSARARSSWPRARSTCGSTRSRR